MRRAHLAALGVALTLGVGALPATATTTAADSSDALVEGLTEFPRNLDGLRETDARARALVGTEEALPTDEYYRIGGASRYATAVEVSKAMVCSPDVPAAECFGLGGVDQPVTTVFVANGLDFPDALGAGPLVTGLGSLLLVPPTGTVPTVVKNELARIGPDDIVIFGGTGAVSSGVEDQLGAYGAVSRIAGSNRYETAAEAALINDEIWRGQDGAGDGFADDHGLDTVVLASGATFADALAGGGAAANSRGALMLTATSSLPTATKSALQEIAARSASAGMSPPEVIILGGTGVVSSAVETAVKTALPGASVVREAGEDRFGTAIAVSERVFGGGAPELFVVNGYNFPDALASAPLAGVWGASTLLAKQTCVTSGTRSEASRLDPLYVTGFGGEGVLSDEALFLEVC